jgi:putative sigma-54 modulation protein
MEIHISGRGVDIGPALRRRVEAKIAKVTRFLPKITEARVVLGLERFRHLAAVTLRAKGAKLHAEGVADDLHAAVDLAVENLAAQARRRKDRVRARKARPSRRPRLAGDGEPPVDAPAEAAPDLVIRRLAAKPMTVDEAVEQMQGRADGVVVFTNARTRAVNVLRRRPDGQLELVQPVG